MNKKARKYGKLDKPYVVAVNLMSATIEDRDVIEALYGPGGVWDRQRNKQVSAVLTTNWLMPISVPRANPRLLHNPSAQMIYDSALTVLPQEFWRESEVEHRDGRSLSDVLGLTATWPHDRNDYEIERD